MVKLECLSDNLILILQQLLANQNLCKLIAYDLKRPLNEPDFNTESLLLDRILPTPFVDFTAVEDFSQVRAYYSRVDLKGPIVENHQLSFDIIVAKNLWLIKDAVGKSKIRPYEIAMEIVNIFDGKSIDTIGMLEVAGFRHQVGNEKFDVFQGSARIVNFSDGD